MANKRGNPENQHFVVPIYDIKDKPEGYEQYIFLARKYGIDYHIDAAFRKMIDELRLDFFVYKLYKPNPKPKKSNNKKMRPGKLYVHPKDVMNFIKKYKPNQFLREKMSIISKMSYDYGLEYQEIECPYGHRIGVHFKICTDKRFTNSEIKCPQYNNCKILYNDYKVKNKKQPIISDDELENGSKRRMRRKPPMRPKGEVNMKNETEEYPKERNKKKSQGKLPLKPLKSESDISETRLCDLIDHLYEMRENDVIREEITNVVVYLSEALKQSRIISADETKKVQHGS